MNTLTDDQLERLDQYINGMLDADAKSEIRSLIGQDPSWHMAYDLRLAARDAGRKVFHGKMRGRFEVLDKAPRQRLNVRPMWFAAAACLVALIAVAFWLMPEKQSPELFAEYRKFPNVVLPIEKSGGEYTVREMAYQFYELGRYDQAIDYFTQVDSLQTPDRLYTGLSYLELGQYQEAAQLLDVVRSSSNPRWSHVADWYSVWLLLKQEKLDDARKALERIANSSGHRYQVEAGKLLDRL